MPVVRIESEPTPLTEIVSAQLLESGWEVTADRDSAVDAVVVDAGLAGGRADSGVVGRLLDGARRWRFRDAAGGGGAIVVIGSRDQLGSAQRAEAAAIAGALASAVRSLALELAPRQVRVNLIAPGDPAADDVRGLLPEPVATEDVAATAAFLADPRSSYITGQVLFCCGGSSLLSSLSV
ncbi:SDR family oxidoreductase [Nocardia harenae]|uniref:SDR family oxidoreductase n=1 Tax=Nocardia harenae TaxID=358707 RepID=UPI00082A4C59|nr:SDR family oxidoreductase [Nocardia harenae]